MTTTTDPHGVSVPRAAASRLAGWLELTVPTMTEIREHRPLVPPLLIGWLLSLLATWTLAPLVGMALADQVEGATSIVQGWMWVRAALAPLVQGGRALLWAVGAWALLTLTSRETSVRSLLSVFLYGEVLVAIHSVLLGLYFQWSIAPGATAVTFLDPLSLATLVPSNHGLWAGLVGQLDLVHAGWTVYVAVASRQVLGLGRGGAWALALTLWLGSIAVATTRILLNG